MIKAFPNEPHLTLSQNTMPAHKKQPYIIIKNDARSARGEEVLGGGGVGEGIYLSHGNLYSISPP